MDEAAFLQKVRERFKYCLEAWRDIRDEHDLDMRFLAGDQWDEREKRDRKDKHRPMVVVDELSQYINQLINDVRENKRGIKVEPKGSGANDKTAANLEGWIRAVEYESNAQSAYISGFEGACGGSYGFWKLQCYYESDKSFDQSVRIVPKANANTVVFDPDCKLYDCSDAADCFEIEFISHEEFKRRYPNAKIIEFTDDIRQMAPEWIKDKHVQLASYWKVKKEKVKLHLVDPKDGREPLVMRDDELPVEVDKSSILKSREIEDQRVVQYVLNGVEVLETNDPQDSENPKGWPGKWIPIIPVWGKEIFVDEGAGSKRILLSLIRIARDAQRLLNYYASQEMEEAKMTPKTPYMGPKGMFSGGGAQGFDDINDTPRAWAEYELPEGVPPGFKPERVPFVPNFQQYELVKESAKRAIQAAMGISPLPTAAQRQNEKSGIALERIQGERQKGTFHFIDNFERSLTFTGRQLEDIYHVLHDTDRQVTIRDRREGQKTVPASSISGDHTVTISTGPSYQSEREKAESFVDTLIGSVPQVFPLIGDLLTRLRLGNDPIGDEIAERLTPPQFAQGQGQEPLPPRATAAIQQAQQQVQILNAHAQKLELAISQLQMEKSAKMIETASRERIAALQEQTKVIIAQAQIQREGAETILQSELQRISEMMAQNSTMIEQMHQHDLIDHQTNADMTKAAQQAALTPPDQSSGATDGK